MLPWHFTGNTTGIFTDENIYALVLLGLTSLYAIKGGMVSVVITEVMQFTILTAHRTGHRRDRHPHGQPGDDCQQDSRRLVESVLRLETRDSIGTAFSDTANAAIKADGNEFFSSSSA
jgi:hypothetical protein